VPGKGRKENRAGTGEIGVTGVRDKRVIYYGYAHHFLRIRGRKEVREEKTVPRSPSDASLSGETGGINLRKRGGILKNAA